MLIYAGAVTTYEKTAPSTNYPKYADIWTFEHVLQPKKEIYSKPKDKLFKVTDITPEQLGFNLTRCNNCGDKGCSLGIHYIVEDSPGEYRINYEFTWETESNRKVSYDRKDRDWKRIENPNVTLLKSAKVLVQSAIFECSKPFNARGSRPTGNCGHSGVAGNCSCGRHQNNVKELIQAGFDRITRIS